MTGKKLGNYEIVDKLGAGGMGEVWRARDPRLNRSVAVKLLPAEFADDVQRRQRFEQEARALGALSHPNIVSIYDVGETDGKAYIVSELVEGESLRAMIDRGPLPARRVMELATQIAEAIGAAHALGIIHRDLKPENIVITPDFRAKVLDFGLAKQQASGPGNDTSTMALSQPGIVLGTVGYMAPEQVRGMPADARSDIFALGCLMYEMATGKRAFDGPSAADVFSAVLKDEPPELPMPPGLDAIVRRCLEKNPGQRFQSAADLGFALRSMSNPSGARPAAYVADKKRHWLRPVVAAVVGLALFAAGYLARARFAHIPKAQFHRLTFREGRVANARFDPTWKEVIYDSVWDGGDERIYLATPGNPESRDLEMPPDSRLLSVSSKGDIALLVGPFGTDETGTLARNSISGGRSRELLTNVHAADWSPDGASMAIVRVVNGKKRIEYPIGKILLESEWAGMNMRLSPNGELVAFTSYAEGSRISINTVDRAGKVKQLGVVSEQNSSVDNSQLCWTRDGREIWYRAFTTKDWGVIRAIDMNGKIRDVAQFPGHVTLFEIAADGRILLSTDTGRIGILALAPDQTAERDVSALDASVLKGLSDDGSMIVSNIEGESGGAKGSIYLRRTDGSPGVRLGDGVAFSISPDGKWVTGYTSKMGSNRRFVLMPTGPGEEVEVPVPELRGTAVVAGWLPGEQNYLIYGSRGNNGWQVFTWDAKAKKVTDVTPAHIADEFPLLMPDRTGLLAKGPDQKFYVYSLQGGQPRLAAGLGEHDIPINWRPDSRTLYVAMHHNENRTIHVSLLDTVSGQRTLWKEIKPAIPVDAVFNIHITPDGKAYAYNYMRQRSELFLASGLK